MPRLTKPQLDMLRFFDLEARDPAAALFNGRTNARTRNLLLERGYLDRQQMWIVGHRRYFLTAKGIDALARKGERHGSRKGAATTTRV